MKYRWMWIFLYFERKSHL